MEFEVNVSKFLKSYFIFLIMFFSGLIVLTFLLKSYFSGFFLIGITSLLISVLSNKKYVFLENGLLLQISFIRKNIPYKEIESFRRVTRFSKSIFAFSKDRIEVKLKSKSLYRKYDVSPVDIEGFMIELERRTRSINNEI